MISSKREDFQGEEKVRLISAVMYDVGHGVFPPGIYPLDVLPDNAFKANVVRKIETPTYTNPTQTIRTGVRVKEVSLEPQTQSELTEVEASTEQQQPVYENNFKKNKTINKKEVNYDN